MTTKLSPTGRLIKGKPTVTFWDSFEFYEPIKKHHSCEDPKNDQTLVIERGCKVPKWITQLSTEEAVRNALRYFNKKIRHSGDHKIRYLKLRLRDYKAMKLITNHLQ